MKRSGPLKRNATMRRQTRLNKVNERKKAKRRKKYDAFLASPAWKMIRNAAIERAGKQCEHQQMQWVPLGIYTEAPAKVRCPETTKLQVHHLRYTRFGGRELPSDLQVLCKAHHEYVEAIKGKHHYSKRAG